MSTVQTVALFYLHFIVVYYGLPMPCAQFSKCLYLLSTSYNAALFEKFILLLTHLNLLTSNFFRNYYDCYHLQVIKIQLILQHQNKFCTNCAWILINSFILYLPWRKTWNSKLMNNLQKSRCCNLKTVHWKEHSFFTILLT